MTSKRSRDDLFGNSTPSKRSKLPHVLTDMHHPLDMPSPSSTISTSAFDAFPANEFSNWIDGIKAKATAALEENRALDQEMLRKRALAKERDIKSLNRRKEIAERFRRQALQAELGDSDEVQDEEQSQSGIHARLPSQSTADIPVEAISSDMDDSISSKVDSSDDGDSGAQEQPSNIKSEEAEDEDSDGSDPEEYDFYANIDDSSESHARGPNHFSEDESSLDRPLGVEILEESEDEIDDQELQEAFDDESETDNEDIHENESETDGGSNVYSENEDEYEDEFEKEEANGDNEDHDQNGKVPSGHEDESGVIAPQYLPSSIDGGLIDAGLEVEDEDDDPEEKIEWNRVVTDEEAEADEDESESEDDEQDDCGGENDMDDEAEDDSQDQDEDESSDGIQNEEKQEEASYTTKAEMINGMPNHQDNEVEGDFEAEDTAYELAGDSDNQDLSRQKQEAYDDDLQLEGESEPVSADVHLQSDTTTSNETPDSQLYLAHTYSAMIAGPTVDTDQASVEVDELSANEQSFDNAADEVTHRSSSNPIEDHISREGATYEPALGQKSDSTSTNLDAVEDERYHLWKASIEMNSSATLDADLEVNGEAADEQTAVLSNSEAHLHPRGHVTSEVTQEGHPEVLPSSTKHEILDQTLKNFNVVSDQGEILSVGAKEESPEEPMENQDLNAIKEEQHFLQDMDDDPASDMASLDESLQDFPENIELQSGSEDEDEDEDEASSMDESDIDNLNDFIVEDDSEEIESYASHDVKGQASGVEED